MSIKQRQEFFKVKPKPGIPLSVPGIAEGLAAIAYALERMNVSGGHVNWANGIPTIVSGSSLPACPGGDGTYFLKATVTDGVCVMSWIEAIEANCGGGA
jgi:hypothetical protein